MIGRNNTLVNFIIIGAQKSGTTSLAYQLTQHHDICFSIRKEPQYFSTTKDWRKSLSTYSRLFNPKPGQLCGEASTSYTFLPEYQDTHFRLHAYNSELKLIYICRHPIDRIISQYTHDVLRGRVSDSFETEVLANPIYIDRTRYAMQVEPYLKLFPRENILLLIFEEFIANKEQTLARVAQFLDIPFSGFQGIDTTPKNASSISGHLKLFPGIHTARKIFYLLPPTLRVVSQKVLQGFGHRYFYNVSDAKPEVSETFRTKLWEMLEDDIKKMEFLLGRSLDHIWGERAL